MGRPSNTEERRTEIVLALSRVMAREGYERATTALIAKEAGLGAGLVHYHFASKAEILHALVEGISRGAESRIESRLAAHEGAMERLDALIDALLARGEGEDAAAVACWALIGAEAVKDVEVRKLYGRFVLRLTDRVATLFEAACHEAGRSAEGKKAVACALVAMIEGYFALAAAVPDTIPAGSAAKMARRAARGLIDAQPPKRERP